MPHRPAVLIMQPALGLLTPFLETAYRVFRLWEGPPVEAQADIEAVVVIGEAPLDTAVLEHLPNLKLIACFTSGYDGIDLDWCAARGVPVTHAPAVNHEDVADHALGLILAARRQIVTGDRTVKAGDWRMESRLMTPSMRGQRIGIVGLGLIGEAVARRVEILGCAVAWWGPRDKTTTWPRAASLLDLARNSDVLVVACRADATNRGLISAEVLQALGPNGLLVNVARGQVVDEDALIAALKSGALGQAALDVFETEPTDAARWVDVPNTVLTPHTAGATTEAVQGMLGLLMRNLAAAMADEPLVTPVVRVI
ncbi:2-hydroxyacid dehydrogenase [Brevundimonas subvibrioides]|uniref:D-isomer specific 2-hydroxyacid dehydrogenase NAD-binding protein n=1 Tax=Brevundimonas subvibrioides (strain ATCC 15264 / DSM 4735 / LMG 14903 / NBRC 16000 / CB 81) TaxID=633149 RepID=D9QK40_BRESC|nr:2-hydroxyacid dehydrogenase [Brevundimonas subvibrioides]ADL01625.1 D-isomer specific 2-hydroxyacid dehydrogenase NAD-binding protein [Brevundimonas subvibrioides ATCC 15264]